MPTQDTEKKVEMAGYIITVIGGKGGQGKSQIAANLAFAYAQENRSKVLLLDFDKNAGGAGTDDDNADKEQEEEGNSGYHWVDGTPFNYQNWAEGEPNSADGN